MKLNRLITLALMLYLLLVSPVASFAITSTTTGALNSNIADLTIWHISPFWLSFGFVIGILFSIYFTSKVVSVYRSRVRQLRSELRDQIEDNKHLHIEIERFKEYFRSLNKTKKNKHQIPTYIEYCESYSTAVNVGAGNEKTTCLIVDDDEYTRLELIKNIGAIYNINCVGAYDTKEAIQRLDAGNIKWIITDYVLGIDRSTGIDLARIVKERNEDTPVLIMTQRVINDGIIESAEEVNAKLIVKPFSRFNYYLWARNKLNDFFHLNQV